MPESVPVVGSPRARSTRRRNSQLGPISFSTMATSYGKRLLHIRSRFAYHYTALIGFQRQTINRQRSFRPELTPTAGIGHRVRQVGARRWPVFMNHNIVVATSYDNLVLHSHFENGALISMSLDSGLMHMDGGPCLFLMQILRYLSLVESSKFHDR